MRLLLFLILALFCCSCRRDKLDGEFDPLVGKWRWLHLTDSTAMGVDTLDQSEAEGPVQWEFLKKGRYRIYSRGKKIESGYIKTSHYYSNDAPVIVLCKGELKMACVVYFHGADTIELRITDDFHYIRRWHVPE